MVEEEYAELEKAAGKLAQQNPDEPAFGNLIKLSKQLTATFELFTKLTPSAQRMSPAELNAAVKQAQKLMELPDKVFDRLKKRLSQQIAALFNVQSSRVQQIDFQNTIKFVKGQVRTIECGVKLL